MDSKMSKMKNEWKTSRMDFPHFRNYSILEIKSFSTFLIESWHFEVHSRRFYMFLNWFARISFVIKINKIELISILIFWSKSLDRDILGRDPSFFFNFKHSSIKIQIFGQNSGHFYSMFISTKQQIRQIQDNCEKSGQDSQDIFGFQILSLVSKPGQI